MARGLIVPTSSQAALPYWRALRKTLLVVNKRSARQDRLGFVRGPGTPRRALAIFVRGPGGRGCSDFSAEGRPHDLLFARKKKFSPAQHCTKLARPKAIALYG
jgi:hypothetical protein